jgi:AcrR family transcriptional regulator
MDDVKNLILDKARDRFDRFGFKKTTMDEISRDCKISKKTIYEHFKDKEDLFNCLFNRETRQAKEIIFARMGEISDPLEKLTQLIKTGIAFFNEDNFLTRLLRDDDVLFSAFLRSKSHNIVDEDIISIIAGIINEGKKQGKIRDVDEQVVAYAGFNLFKAFSYMRTVQFCEEKEKKGYYTDVLVDFIINALTKK